MVCNGRATFQCEDQDPKTWVGWDLINGLAGSDYLEVAGLVEAIIPLSPLRYFKMALKHLECKFLSN